MTTESPISPAPANRLVKGRYRLSHPLGRGGMGTVWLARDELLGRRVALKEIVLSGYGERPAVLRQRALREARAAASITHPSIVEIYDVFEESAAPWIVMAYIQGRSLDQRITSSGLPEREIAEIGRCVLGALDAAHQANVLHRDVKPANIVISREGEVFLVDFGIAHIGGESGLTSRNVLLGTLEFMAPERIDGLIPGPPSDLWSLGVTLFYALEGRSPFRRDSLPTTLRAITSQDPPRSTRPGLLADAIVRLLDKDPARRMTVPELDQVLESIIVPPPVRPPVRHKEAPPPPVQDTRRLPKTRRLPETRRFPEARSSPEAGSHPEPEPRGPAPTSVVDRGGRRSSSAISPERVRDVLARAGPTAAAAILLAQSQKGAAEVLAVIEPKVAGPLLDGMAVHPGRTAGALRLLLPSRAVAVGRMMNYMSADRAAALLGAMPLSEAASVLAVTDVRTAAGILGVLGATSLATRLVEAMTVRRACQVFEYVPPATIAALLEASSDGRANRLLSGLSQPVRGQVRRCLQQK